MDRNLELVMEDLERGLRESTPICDVTELAQGAWNELQEAVAEGYMTRVDAEELFFQHFNTHT